MPERTDHNEAMRQHERDSRELRELCAQRDAARATVRQQAERIAELERDYGQACRLVANLHTAATGSMQGPKRGVVEDVADVATERDQLRAEVERLRVDAERYQWLADCENFYEAICLIANPSLTAHDLGTAIDAARTTHKDEA